MTAARAIIEKAEAIGAGVIAMATHGRTGIARLVMGSCADAVLRGAPQAMLLYRPTERGAESGHVERPAPETAPSAYATSGS